MGASKRRTIYCSRCGKPLTHYQYMVANNGENGFVCADDRLCGSWQRFKRFRPGKNKSKVLQKHKEMWCE